MSDLPPAVAHWVSASPYLTFLLVVLILAAVYGIIRGAIVNFLKIFHKKDIVIVVRTPEGQPTADSIGQAVREQLREHLGIPIPDQRPTRMSVLDEDDD